MKSEHRHELETNQLSAGLARAIENFKPYSSQILTGIVLLAVLYVGLTLWNSRNDQLEREAWLAYAKATDTSDPEMQSLQRVARDEQYSGTKMREWAYLGWADRQVLNAMSSYLIDREVTNDRLKNVIDVYENLANDAVDPQVLNRARFGLARVYELQNKLDEARTQYLRIRGDLQALAAERAELLESEDVKEASLWLASAELPKRDLTGGQGASGARPSFNADLPAVNDSINSKSLEELLGEFESETTPDSENRYGEEEESPEVDSEKEFSTDEAISEESESEDNTEADETDSTQE